MKPSEILFLAGCSVLLLMTICMGLKADLVEEDKGPAATRVFESDGYHRGAFRIDVGSVTAVKPYDVVPGSTTRESRSLLIINTNPNFQLMCATWPAFADTDAAWFVPEASGTWQTYGRQDFWCRFPQGASSAPVRGIVGSQ